MRTLIATASAAAMGLSAVAYAQDEGTEGTDTPEVETEETSNGAIVTRESIVEDVLDENGDPIPVLDENGVQLEDENGNLVFETAEVGFVQTVETPSGIVHTITKVDGERAIVEHDRSGHRNAEKFERTRIAKAERAERAERPEKPEKPEKPERPEKPEKPERPEKPEKPGRP